MPRINSPQKKSRTGLLHGREQTPFGSQNALFFGKDEGPQDSKRVSPTLPPFETSVSISGCQGTTGQNLHLPYLCMNTGPNYKFYSSKKRAFCEPNGVCS